MAKGDGSSQLNNPQAPKMDQYSVMHGIMDRLGQGGSSIAPLHPPIPSNMGGAPAGPRFGGGGPMGNPMGQLGTITPMGQGNMSVQPQGFLAGDQFPQQSIAPINIQDIIRRRMMGNNTAG